MSIKTKNPTLQEILKVVHSYNKYHKDFNSEKDEQAVIDRIKEILAKEVLQWIFLI